MSCSKIPLSMENSVRKTVDGYYKAVDITSRIWNCSKPKDLADNT